MDKKAAPLSTVLSRCLDEVSKGDQHLLSQVWTPLASFSNSLQGWQGPHNGVGNSQAGQTKAWVWRAEVSRAQTHRKDNQEIAGAIEMPHLQLHAYEVGY
jgi:hypothetical protein